MSAGKCTSDDPVALVDVQYDASVQGYYAVIGGRAYGPYSSAIEARELSRIGAGVMLPPPPLLKPEPAPKADLPPTHVRPPVPTGFDEALPGIAIGSEDGGVTFDLLIVDRKLGDWDLLFSGYAKFSKAFSVAERLQGSMAFDVFEYEICHSAGYGESAVLVHVASSVCYVVDINGKLHQTYPIIDRGTAIDFAETVAAQLRPACDVYGDTWTNHGDGFLGDDADADADSPDEWLPKAGSIFDSPMWPPYDEIQQIEKSKTQSAPKSKAESKANKKSKPAKSVTKSDKHKFEPLPPLQPRIRRVKS